MDNSTSTFKNPTSVSNLLKPYHKSEDINETYKKFKTVYVYCKDYDKYTFVECPLKIIKYSFLLNNLSTVRKVDIEQHLKCNNITFNGHLEDVLVLFLPFINSHDLQVFVSQYINENTFMKYLTSLAFNNILSIRYQTVETELNRIKLLCSLDETSYWQLAHNCAINITDKFLLRDFRKEYTKNEIVIIYHD